MGERSGYAPGTFSWVDLATPDPEGAKRFYADLLGWDHEDMPVGDGQVYTMARLGGRAVAGIYSQPEDQLQAGIPSSWLSHVTVGDVDAAAARASELGGTALAAPFDVLEAGRMAVLADPQGAPFAVWQPKDSIGAELVNVPGALTWNQLATSDTSAAVEFYTELFGWTTEEVEAGDEPYWSFRNSENWMNGGVMGLPPGAPAPPHWLPYFASDGVDAHAARVGELGGTVVVPIVPVPAGRLFVAQDPGGAAFGLFEGDFDP